MGSVVQKSRELRKVVSDTLTDDPITCPLRRPSGPGSQGINFTYMITEGKYMLYKVSVFSTGYRCHLRRGKFFEYNLLY